MSTKTKRTTVAETIRETLIHSMKKDKNIILFGEGIDDGAAMFKTTKGLTKIFGPKRVFEMPLSENLFESSDFISKAIASANLEVAISA